MKHDVESQILDMQVAGIQLYADLASWYYWLGAGRMSRVLCQKLEEAMDNHLTTRFQFIDQYGGIIRPREPPSEITNKWKAGQQPAQAAPKEDYDRLYNNGLRRWLAYEEAMLALYKTAEDADGWFEGLANESQEEIDYLKDSLSI